ncbi:MAG: phosphodiester glycosidase family protein [Candidatus Ancaeobacter aquaticus]|nr:phosphodiester glycosidase family protein [Candidatus Ancaeobacter aquaticus]
MNSFSKTLFYSTTIKTIALAVTISFLCQNIACANSYTLAPTSGNKKFEKFRKICEELKGHRKTVEEEKPSKASEESEKKVTQPDFAEEDLLRVSEIEMDFEFGRTKVAVVEIDPNIYGVHLIAKSDLQGSYSLNRTTETLLLNIGEGVVLTDPDKIREHVWTDEDAIEVFKNQYPDLKVVAYIDNCSLFSNRGFVAYINGDLFYFTENVSSNREKEKDKQKVLSSSHTSLVIMKSGEIRMGEVSYSEVKGTIHVALDGADITDEVAYATFGQFLLDGQGVPRRDMKEIVPQFQDLRHVYKTPKITANELSGIKAEVQKGREMVSKPELFFGILQLSENNYQLAKDAWNFPVSLPLKVKVSFSDGDEYIDVEPELLSKGLEEIGYVEKPKLKEIKQEGDFYIGRKRLHIFFKKGPYPRTIVGIVPVGKENRLVVAGVEGLSGIKGTTIIESAQLAAQLGMKQAMLLDHGMNAKIFANGRWLVPVKATNRRKGKTSALFIARKKEPVQELVELEKAEKKAKLTKTKGKELKKQPLLLEHKPLEVKSIEVKSIAECLLPPVSLRSRGDLERMRDKLMDVFTLETLKNISKTMPEVWDSGDRLIHLDNGAFRNFVNSIAEIASKTGRTKFQLRDKITIEDLNKRFLKLPESDVREVMVVEESELPFNQAYQALGYLVSAGKEQFNLAYTAKILGRTGLISAGVWKMILATNRAEKDSAQKRGMSRTRTLLFHILKQCRDFMSDADDYDGFLSDKFSIEAVEGIAGQLNWGVGIAGNKRQLMLTEEITESMTESMREEISGIKIAKIAVNVDKDKLEEPETAGTRDMTVYSPGVLQIDVKKLLDKPLVDRIKFLLDEDKCKEAAVLLFIGTDPEEFKIIVEFLKGDDMWPYNAALLVKNVDPAFGAYFLVQAVQMHKQGWLKRMFRVGDEQSIKWVIDILDVIDMATTKADGEKTPAGEILWEMLINDKIPKGEELVGKVLKKTLGDEGVKLSDWKLGISFYEQLLSKMGDFSEYLNSVEDIKKTGELLKKALPKSLSSDRQFGMAGEEKIIKIIENYLDGKEFRQVSDILFLKLSPTHGYRLLKKILKEDKYGGDITQIFAFAQPWIAARFFSEIFKAGDDEDKMYKWIIKRFTDIYKDKEIPKKEGDISFAARILCEMILNPAEKGGNRMLAVSFLELGRNIDYADEIQDIYDEIHKDVPDVVDWQTFSQTGKFLTSELNDNDKKIMLAYWEERMTPVGSLESINAVRAIGRLGTSSAYDILFKQFYELDKTGDGYFSTYGKENYDEYKSTVVKGLVRFEATSLAKSFVMKVKAGGEMCSDTGLQNLFKKVGREGRLDFILSWLKEGGDDNTLDKLLSFAENRFLEEEELAIPVRLIKLEGIDELIKYNERIKKIKKSVGDSRTNETLRKCFIKLYIEPAVEVKGSLAKDGLTRMLDVLYIMEINDAPLGDEDMKSMVELLRRSRGHISDKEFNKAINVVYSHLTKYVYEKGVGLRNEWTMKTMSVDEMGKLLVVLSKGMWTKKDIKNTVKAYKNSPDLVKEIINLAIRLAGRGVTPRGAHATLIYGVPAIAGVFTDTNDFKEGLVQLEKLVVAFKKSRGNIIYIYKDGIPATAEALKGKPEMLKESINLAIRLMEKNIEARYTLDYAVPAIAGVFTDTNDFKEGLVQLEKLVVTLAEKGVDPFATSRIIYQGILKSAEALKGKPEMLKESINLAIRLAEKGIDPWQTLYYGIPATAKALEGKPEMLKESINLAIRLAEEGIDPNDTLKDIASSAIEHPESIKEKMDEMYKANALLEGSL